MNLPITLKNKLDLIFSAPPQREGFRRTHYVEGFDSLCSVFIHPVTSTDNFIEIPLVAASEFLDAVRLGYSSFVPICPLSESSFRNVRFRTSDAILKAFANERNLSNGLLTVTTNTGVTYKGLRGLIMDSEYKVLYTSTIHLTRSDSNHPYRLAKISNYFSPSIFTNTDIVSKAILNRMLPYVAESSTIRVFPSSIACPSETIIKDINIISRSDEVPFESSYIKSSLISAMEHTI